MGFNQSIKMDFLYYISLKQFNLALNHSKKFRNLRLLETINYGFEPL